MGWRENLGAAPKIFLEIETKEHKEQKEQKPDERHPSATIATIADRQLNLKLKGIEQTDNCHSYKCEHLDSRTGERPRCQKANDYIFDLGQCPVGHFGPLTPACGSYKFKN
jgi:hypothetical protein